VSDRKYDDRLASYVEVKDRIRLFYEAHPDGRLVTTDVRATSEPDGTPRVWVEASAYRSADDPLPGRGWSWMVLPGSTPYTKGSELENTETSAWGRAIGSLGIGIEKSIASANEVRSKGGEVRADVDRGDDGSLIGTVEVGDKASSDFLLRQSPDGPILGFRLRGARGGILVRTTGDLAEQLNVFRDAAIGSRVTCWGRIASESFTPRGKPGEKPSEVTYQVLAADRVSVPEVGVLPAVPTPEASVAPVGLTEAESAAIWDTIEGIGA
jgi:hypothetical protein